MRRGTPSAILFGRILFIFRTSYNKMTMRQTGFWIQAPAATVSQVEKGIRAVKEPKIKVWAAALGVEENDLLELWWLAQGFISQKDGSRIFYMDHDDLVNRITKIMKRYVKNYDLEIPKIERLGPIARQRTRSTSKTDLEQLISSLNSAQRTRVQGYIEALLDMD